MSLVEWAKKRMWVLLGSPMVCNVAVHASIFIDLKQVRYFFTNVCKDRPPVWRIFKDLSQCFQVSFLAGRFGDKPVHSLTKLTTWRLRALEKFMLPLASGSPSSSKGTLTVSALTSGACGPRVAPWKECTAQGGWALMRKPSWAQFSVTGVNRLNSEPRCLGDRRLSFWVSV